MDTTNMYIAGCLSGAITTAAFHPLDAIRVRLFYDYKSMGNIASFYNGIGFNITTGCIKNMLVYPTQEHFKNILTKKGYTKYESEIYSSIWSGFLLSTASTPINVIKIPLQSNVVKHSASHMAKEIYSKYGLLGFYRGGMGTFVRDLSWNCTYFPLFRYINDNITDNKILSSILAGSVSMTVSYPFDGVRLYRQNNNKNYNFWYGFFRAFNWSYANFKSYGMSLLRIPISTTVSHMCYLYISQWLMNKQ